jgi:hypothetical protein
LNEQPKKWLEPMENRARISLEPDFRFREKGRFAARAVGIGIDA